jgi:hypothetical protein
MRVLTTSAVLLLLVILIHANPAIMGVVVCLVLAIVAVSMAASRQYEDPKEDAKWVNGWIGSAFTLFIMALLFAFS